MKSQSRLLGLAFAAADLLFEVDETARITFAVGAGPIPGDDPAVAWAGVPLGSLLGKASRKEVSALLSRIQVGVRLPPVDILVDCGGGRVRRARLRAFQLPELAPAVSCALAWEGQAFPLALPAAPPLLDAQTLLERTRLMLQERGRQDTTMAFVDVPGLSGEKEAHQRAAARVEAALQAASTDGVSAARLAPERFALACRPEAVQSLTDDIREAGQAEGLDLAPLGTHATVAAGTDVGVALRALRFTLGDQSATAGGLAANLENRLRRTIEEAARFRRVVKEREFSLQFQPIVELSTGAVHHFEALARFDGKPPTDTIRMAEELGLISGFDLAVAEKAIQMLRRPGYGLTKLAINVSGLSLGGDEYVQGLLRMTSAFPDIRARLMVEVTETAALADMDAATRRLGDLRRVGIKVCLDDFGAGAASFDYLRRLQLDTVKIDGAFVRDLDGGARSSTLIGHLVELCGDLGLATVGEMVETQAQADILRGLGVRYGQGWLFGRPSADPVAPPSVLPRARRIGAVASWA